MRYGEAGNDALATPSADVALLRSDTRMTSSTDIRPPRSAPIARGVGALLGAAFAGLQRLRPPRPIHGRGVVLDGRMRWLPDAAPSGISWIDQPPAEPVPVVARVSRSIGLPAPMPDVIGLALRLGADGRPVDVEMASTGWHVPARFALLPHRRAERARFGVLLPYLGRGGPVLLGARTFAGRPPATDPRELDADAADAGWTLTLGHATPLGPWHPFARLDLRLDSDQDDTGLRVDAVRHPLTGARAYAWVRAVRQPSYERVQPVDAPVRMPRATGGP